MQATINKVVVRSALFALSSLVLMAAGHGCGLVGSVKAAMQVLVKRRLYQILLDQNAGRKRQRVASPNANFPTAI